MQTLKISYKRHQFPPQIIAHVVWLYVRFNLSLRKVEELMLDRGVDVSYETIRRWTVKLGPLVAHVLRRRQPRPGDVWHLGEVVVKIAGRSYWLWRAVDQHDVVLGEILQSKRDKRAAKREVAPGLDHWSHKGLNNRAENSHLPLRKRERVMHCFRPPGGLQRFVSMQSATRNRFSVPALRRSALTIRYHRLETFEASKSSANGA